LVRATPALLALVIPKHQKERDRVGHLSSMAR
jgi:hypothetical protein